MKRTLFSRLKNKWAIGGLIAIVLIIIVAVSRSSSAKAPFESAPAAIADVIETVSVTGSISPADRSDLSFQKGGVISAVYVKVGDPIKKGDQIASLDTAADTAALEAAQATYADTARGLTPQELAVQKTSVSNAEQDAVNAAHDAYTKAQSALFNYSDSFFNGGQSANPTIMIRTDGQPQQIAINHERLVVTDALQRWSADLANAASLGASALISRSSGYVGTVKAFMADLSGIVSALSPGNSGTSQAVIDAELSTMNTAVTLVNAAMDSVTAAQTALASARSAYDLKLAGNSSQSIQAQAARVAQAQAALDADTIESPIDGIVTRADSHIGEYVAPGASGFAVQGTSFKIEANVPEADIAKVAVGDLASTTLDAYGPYVDFPSQVVSIDPAETVIEGVPTYKTTLHFLSTDGRIRSGMTANLDILTHERQGVLAIPFRAVTQGDGSATVRVVNSDGKTWSVVPVTTGLKGSSGTIEIVSGLQPGDKVVTYTK